MKEGFVRFAIQSHYNIKEICTRSSNSDLQNTVYETAKQTPVLPAFDKTDFDFLF